MRNVKTTRFAKSFNLSAKFDFPKFLQKVMPEFGAIYATFPSHKIALVWENSLKNPA